MTLANLHSDAVDYPKSGQPVALSAIPRLKFKVKPDWDAPETVNLDSARYYESQRAIGQLSRAIDLPALQVVRRTERRQHHQLEQDRDRTIEDLLAGLQLHDDDDDTVGLAVETRVAEFISLDFTYAMVEEASNLFDRYVSELQSICRAHTISHARSAMLTEEEVVVGTIVAKTSQPRKRRETMARMREVTDQLVLTVREDLIGGEEANPDSSLERGWVAWRLSVKNKYFGSKSFGWIALGVIFEAIKEIEAAEK
jgi:RNA-dependent RNA polymerase